ncbi:MAG TPA: hypothetical protein VL691_09465 [Vicinamibacteria bacterium]|nr:hypothetical protein [Vicinamibacteria bacterium]
MPPIPDPGRHRQVTAKGDMEARPGRATWPGRARQARLREHARMGAPAPVAHPG